jgi:hypothetical protein
MKSSSSTGAGTKFLFAEITFARKPNSPEKASAFFSVHVRVVLSFERMTISWPREFVISPLL